MTRDELRERMSVEEYHARLALERIKREEN